MGLLHPLALAQATAHRELPHRRTLLMAFFLVLYAVAAHYIYQTAGEPYQVALKEHERLEALQNETAAAAAVAAEQTPAAAALDPAAAAAAAAAAPNLAFGDAEDEPAGPAPGSPALVLVNATSADDGLNATELLRKERPLPHEWLPNAWVCVGTFLLCTAHALFYLMCHWSVDFKARTFFGPAREAGAGCYIRFRPMPHKGKAALVKLERSARTGRLVCEFQRQQYEILPAEEARAADTDGELVADGAEATQALRLVRSAVDKKVGFYTGATGLASAEEVAERTEGFGPNLLSVRLPSFLELYVEQLLSPLAIFQVFTSLLWLLDAVSLGFTAFQVASILLLESTSVFQRQRMLKTLNQMSAKPFGLQVYREGKWQRLTTTALLPGDLISLTPPAKRATGAKVAAPAGPAAGAGAGGEPVVTEPGQPAAPAAGEEGSNDVVPCDCLILRGSAVVNEASLTGESVPQMKDQVPADATERALDMNGRDRVHAMFAGTSIMSAGAGGAAPPKGVPPTPDGGCLCYVLRTGFSSSQGELMQMIEFSQQQVSDDSKEMLGALGLLLAFALASSAYVLRKGLERGDRTTHELLLKCVIIITSVVPRHLPMQTAMAVNTALMALMKKGVFCTEPFRVPFAGKIDSVLFDKTGTLTSDKLVPIAVVNPGAPEGDAPSQVEVRNAAVDTAVVLAGCHSLVTVPTLEGLVGDPIEVAALEGVEWSYDHATQTATPGQWRTLDKTIALIREKLDQDSKKAAQAAQAAHQGATGPLMAPPQSMPPAARERLEKDLATAEERLATAKRAAASAPMASVRIVARHHFSSALGRMSTVAEVTPRGGQPETRCLVKGSPEAVLPLIAPSSCPAWFEATYRRLAENGMRVLALASKKAPAEASGWSRAEVESALSFAGFIAFACKTRSDSPMVVKALLESAHSVSMLTGDAPLTALHVAKEVGICDEGRPELLLTEASGGEPLRWLRAVGGSTDTVAAFEVSTVRELAAKYDLMATDAALDAAVEATGGELLAYMDCFKVFARMSPQGKARVIRMLQEKNGRRVLMCGDGGNDVGALKQADVGLALLSGYGDQNTSGDAGKEGDEGKVVEGGKDGDGPKAEEALNKQTMELARKAAQSAAIQRQALQAKQRELQSKQAQWISEELERRTAQGLDNGVFGHVEIIKKTTSRMRKELEDERRRLQAIHGNVYDAQKDALSKLTSEMAADTDKPMVRPGDASVAAPFTSRSPSVRNIVDLIRQGRCTLLSALQQQQIMMLESLISAYVLSALSLEGARSSERQMIASSWLLMIASVAFSYATPVERMHPERPLRRLFHPAIFVSMAGQALIHLFCMRTAVNMATEEMGPAKLAEVVEFHRRERLRELKEAQQEKAMEEGDWMAASLAIWSTPFLPNLLNTCVFLVETSQCVAVLLVNYKGRPWMKGITENHALFLSVFATVVSCAALSWSVFPQLNELIHLEPFPDDAFRLRVRAPTVLRCSAPAPPFAAAWPHLLCTLTPPPALAVGAGYVPRLHEPLRHIRLGPHLHPNLRTKRVQCHVG